MVSKILFIVRLVLSTATCRSLYVGDVCSAENQVGNCQILTDCLPLMNEIRNAGSPLPKTLRKRLISLNCGFRGDQPMVCCRTSILEESGQHNFGNDQGRPNRDWEKTTSFSQRWESSTANANEGWKENNNITSINDNWAFGANNNAQIFDKLENKRRDNETDGFDHFSQNTVKTNGPPDVTNHRNLRLLPKNCGAIDDYRIVGGNRTGLFEMPWMVLLSYESRRGTQYNCGGTLINKWYVLTAAHCVTNLGSKTLASVVVGEHDVNQDPDCEYESGQLDCAPGAKNFTVDSVITHPDYSQDSLNDDIALIKLSEAADLSLSNVQPICLPTTPALQSESLTGMKGIVAGWGTTNEGLQSSVLLSVKLPIYSNEDCQTYFKSRPISEKQLCAGGNAHEDSCGGDSGGPLLYPGLGSQGVVYVQRGIVSVGSKKCGTQGYPGIYTSVAYYIDWILDNISD